MKDYKSIIDKGLLTENPPALLPWQSTKKELCEIFGNIKKVNENYFTIQVSLPQIPFFDCIGLHFDGEILSKIELMCLSAASPDKIKDRFFTNQILLEKTFGRPKKCFLKKLFIQDSGTEFYEWKFANVSLVHKLWDRFGMEEITEFIIRYK